MLDLEQMRQQIADERKAIEHTLDLLAKLDTALLEREKALDQYEAQIQRRTSSLGVEHAVPEPSALIQPNAETLVPLTSIEKPTNIKRPKNVVVYEDILLSVGHPMHATALGNAAEAHGIVYRSKGGDKAKIIRNALLNCKRFVNVGGNTWWLQNRPIPEPIEPPVKVALIR